MNQTIKVTGKGVLNIKPDLIIILLNCQGFEFEYENAVRRATKDAEYLNNILSRIGFEKKDLKTTLFNINRKTENYQDQEGVWKHRFIGYEYNQQLKFSFVFDNQLLGKVLFALSKSEIDPEIIITYGIQDIEKAKNQLLVKAVADSKAKAMILAQSVGHTLGKVINVDYSWEEIKLSALSYNMAPRLLETTNLVADQYNININPDDLKIEDTVTIIFEIN